MKNLDKLEHFFPELVRHLFVIHSLFPGMNRAVTFTKMAYLKVFLVKYFAN
jgi:hypothetical protein